MVGRGFTALHHVSSRMFRGDPELAAYLIERGAAVGAQAASGLGMLEKLVELIGSNPKVVHQRGPDGMRPLHFAATPDIAEFLLDHGADINAQDKDHEGTPAQ